MANKYIVTIRDQYTKAYYKVDKRYQNTAVVVYAQNESDAQEIAINTFCNVARTEQWRFFDTTCDCCASVDFRTELYSISEDEKWNDASFAEMDAELVATHNISGYTTLFAGTNNGLHDYRARKASRNKPASFETLACDTRR